MKPFRVPLCRALELARMSGEGHGIVWAAERALGVAARLRAEGDAAAADLFERFARKLSMKARAKNDELIAEAVHLKGAKA